MNSLRLDIQVHSTPLNMTTSGLKYFTFQSTRYILTNNTFQPFVPHLGTTNHDIHIASNGLSSERAHYVKELVGDNRISVELDGWWTMFGKEFWTWFGMYQFLTLCTWWQFNYWCTFLSLY